MTTETPVEKRMLCPACGKKGKRVSAVTVNALVKGEYAGELHIGQPAVCESSGSGCQPRKSDTGWRFCDAVECDVVYFAEDHDQAFTRSQLRVPVGVKETTGERPLCYCFGHTIGSIKKKILATGRSDALEDIRAKMKDPGCICETTNPSGSCCLGSVAKGIETAQEELNMNESTIPSNSVSTPSTNRGETIAKVGTVLSAIMASSCCWLPLVLLAVGVSGAGIAATLEAYRPLFIAVTFGFLGAAFYFTYRPRKSATCEGGSCSTADACCAVPNDATRRRFSRMTMNKVMLWGVTVLAVAFLFFPKYVGFFLASREDESEAAATNALVNKTTIAIEGMTCEACAVALQTAIKDVPGVLGAKVDFNNGTAVVSTEDCCPFPKDEIVKAIEQAGYKAKVKRQS